MTDEELVQAVVAELRASRKYGTVAEEVLERTARRAAVGARSRTEAVHLARRKLHQVFGAFIGAEALKRAQRLAAGLAEARDDNQVREVCRRVLACHASTAERLPYLDPFYAAVAELVPQPRTVVDVACGLNPFALPWMHLPDGAEYTGVDLDSRLAGVAQALQGVVNVQLRVEVDDAVSPDFAVQAELVLLLKTLTAVEQQAKGAAAALLHNIDAHAVAVSMPALSLGGRNRGMREHYDEMMVRIAPDAYTCTMRVEFPSETLYGLVRRR